MSKQRHTFIELLQMFLIAWSLHEYYTQYCIESCDFEVTSKQMLSKFREIMSSLENFSPTVSALGISYKYQNVDVIVKHANELIRESDVFTGMLIFIETTSCTDNFTGQLHFAIQDLKVLSDNMTSDGYKVNDIISVFQLTDVQAQISKYVKYISSINQQFLVFMQNISVNNALKLVNYYDNIDPILKIGELLTNNTETPIDSPLFGQIIKQNEYCNGSEILQVFNYLLTVYIHGCVPFSIAEAVKFNSEITRVRNVCVSTLENAKIMRVKLSKECKKESAKNCSGLLCTIDFPIYGFILIAVFEIIQVIFMIIIIIIIIRKYSSKSTT